jgi:hypothetical protein
MHSDSRIRSLESSHDEALTSDGAERLQLGFLAFHESPPSTRSDTPSRQPSLILLSLGLQSVSTITLEQFESLLPPACQWAAEQERHILAAGKPLSQVALADAQRVGVAQPLRVHILYVPEIPIPQHPALRAAAEQTQLISPLTGGLTLRYGIFIRSDCAYSRSMVIHELGHTAQYERLGGFEPFLRQYLFECLTIGYPEAPMEQEVISLTARISGNAQT